MNSVILFAIAVGLAVAFPESEKPKPEVIRNEYINNGGKGYNFA